MLPGLFLSTVYSVITFFSDCVVLLCLLANALNFALFDLSAREVLANSSIHTMTNVSVLFPSGQPH